MWVIGSVGFGMFVYGNNEELLFAVDKSSGESDSDDGV
jgi:hypothetical protein